MSGLPGIVRRTAAARDVVGRLVRDDLADLLLGSACVGCERPGRVLCRDCAVALQGPAVPAVPDPSPPGLPPVWTAAAYDGIARSALLAHKEHGRTGLSRPLGDALAQGLAAVARTETDAGSAAGEGGGVALLVPVPSTRSAVRRRGYDPLLRLTRRAAATARTHGWAARVCPALALGRSVADQAGLDAAARWHNLAGAFEVRRGFAALLEGRPVVLVDNVVTTGATLAEGAAALRRCGASVRAAVVVAATARRLAT